MKGRIPRWWQGKSRCKGDTLAGMRTGWRIGITVLTVLAGAGGGVARAGDSTALHVTLTNGFDLICDHRETVGDRVRLYLEPEGQSFVEVAGAEIAMVEAAPPLPRNTTAQVLRAETTAANPTPEELRGMMSKAGAIHNLDVDLLASVVRAESVGNTH